MKLAEDWPALPAPASRLFRRIDIATGAPLSSLESRLRFRLLKITIASLWPIDWADARQALPASAPQHFASLRTDSLRPPPQSRAARHVFEPDGQLSGDNDNSGAS